MCFVGFFMSNRKSRKITLTPEMRMACWSPLRMTQREQNNEPRNKTMKHTYEAILPSSEHDKLRLNQVVYWSNMFGIENCGWVEGFTDTCVTVRLPVDEENPRSKVKITISREAVYTNRDAKEALLPECIEYYTGCLRNGTLPVFFTKKGKRVEPEVLSESGGVLEVKLHGMIFRTHPGRPIRETGFYTLIRTDLLA